MKVPRQEAITIRGKRVLLDREVPPNHATLVSGMDPLLKWDIRDERLKPDNQENSDGAPLTLVKGAGLKLDLSKRRVKDMGFWHRSVDFSEIIVCIDGALTWETEIGSVTLLPGEFIVIPRGIAHRSRLSEQSTPENLLLEIKIDGDLEPSEHLVQLLTAGAVR